MQPPREAARAALGLGAADQVVAVLPGSRRSEIQSIAPRFLQAVVLLHRQRPGLRFVLPVVPGLRELLLPLVAQHAAGAPLQLVDGQSHAALAACDVTLIASGTATLNQWYERDADALMKRTAMRPIPAGKVPALNALLFGIALTDPLAIGVPSPLAALLALSAAVQVVLAVRILVSLARGLEADLPVRQPLQDGVFRALVALASLGFHGRNIDAHEFLEERGAVADGFLEGGEIPAPELAHLG
jgi:hypothetical protein